MHVRLQRKKKDEGELHQVLKFLVYFSSKSMKEENGMHDSKYEVFGTERLY